ncbi:EAL and GGDEF domain-containing protein [Acidisoma sp.]|uniref:sensor domain-containing protein n=1 Tax=Acidisoma sp. TaxID=1872115 RepID=UPI003AFFA2F9
MLTLLPSETKLAPETAGDDVLATAISRSEATATHAPDGSIGSATESLLAEVTERQRVEAALAGQIAAIDTTHAVIEFGLDGTILSANESFLAALGYELEELQGKHHRILVDPSYRNSPGYQQFWESLGEGDYQGGEYRRIGKTGGEVWLQATYIPVFGKDGRAYKIIKLATDITAQKRKPSGYSGVARSPAGPAAETAGADPAHSGPGAHAAHWGPGAHPALLDAPPDARLRLFEGVVIQSSAGVMITDAGHLDPAGPRIVYTNPAFTAMTGYGAEEVVGKTPLILQGPRTGPEVTDRIRSALSSWKPVLVDILHYRKDATPFWVELSISPICNENGRYTHWLFAQRDIAERKLLSEALMAQNELLEVTLKSIGDAVICTDLQGNVTFSNIVAEKLLGAAAGPPTVEILRMIDACRNGPQSPAAAGSGDTPILPPDYTLTRSDGCKIAVEGCVTPIFGRASDEAGKVIVFRDVTVARAVAHQTKHAAYHDALTGLPNRLLLSDRIEQAVALAKRHQKPIAVLFLDLDGFKHINDTLGHAIGDKLLQSVGNRLVSCVRLSDTVSRQGGDEFVILVSDMSEPPDAAIAARRFLQVLGEPHSLDGHELQITASIGISVFPDDGLDAPALIKAADTAMYKVKASGRHGYQFFEAAMRAGAVEREYLEEGLHHAIENREFALHYQPKIDIRTGALTGAEALIRWTHPTRGAIPPGVFIPVAETCGLISKLGAWALREACEQGRRWTEAGLPAITLAVNVSPIEFEKRDFLQGVLNVLDETGYDPKNLELEMTEGVLMKRAASTDAMLKGLKDTGLRLALDDFGTGYSSLSYLTKFPIDTIKIDQSFVRQISTDPTETAIVTAVISMAHSLNLMVVAEGVETREELDFLSNLGCDEAQGYYFSRPVPAAAFMPLLQKAASNHRPV